ncbi:unnamed protein product [Ilex paraguariensis]|uniref:SWI/SNF complex subunit SWI3B n=1 Tax=Ilex paraguariensis TaxID=185542 RepID=A0ABC8UGZ9_9AQUA
MGSNGNEKSPVQQEPPRPRPRPSSSPSRSLSSSSAETTTPTPTPTPPPPQEPLQQQLHPSPAPTTLTSDIPASTVSKATTVTSRPQEQSSTDSDVIHIPSYSRWFSWNNIHECEVRFLPEFFDGRWPSKTPRVYKYFRNTIIRRFRQNPTRKITFTEARKTIIGDVGSIRRVFDFLEVWGLINYSGSGSKPQLKWEDKESSKSNAAASSQSGDPGGTSAADVAAPKKRLCNGCKSACSIACFTCDKFDLTLCARCYVRGNYRVGVSSTDFRRVEISEEVKTDWTDKETLHLLEAIMHYGDDWKKVAEHVGGRSERECVARFIKLPFREQFVGPPDSAEVDFKFYQSNDQNDSEFGSPTKRMCLTPLADASNPIMAQSAFLSALAGVEVAEAAAHAAVWTLSEVSDRMTKDTIRSLTAGARQQESDVKPNGASSRETLEVVHVEVRLQLEKEEQDVERAIAGIVEVQTKEIQDKIVHFEELELQMEKEWQHLQQMKNLLFVDQLTLLFHKTAARKTGESTVEIIKSE